MTPRGAQGDPPAAHQLALQGVASVVRGFFAAADRDEVRTRYSAGEVLRSIKRAPQTYGTAAIEYIAEELGVSVSALYRYIAVAETWTKEDLVALIGKTNRFGRPLSWSHFVALTGIDDAKERLALLNQSLENAWSARELEHRIEKSGRSAGRDGDAAHPGEAVHAALKEGVQTGGRTLAEWRTLASALRERLADAEAPVDERLLEQALVTWEELRDQADEMVGHLRVASDSQRRVRVAEPAPLAQDDEESEEEREAAARRQLAAHRPRVGAPVPPSGRRK